MTTEEQINARLDDAMERYMTENERMQRGAVSDLRSVRLEILDLLEEYARADGTINKSRINSLLRRLNEVEGVYIDEISDAIEQATEESQNMAVEAAISALGGIVAAGIIGGLSIGRVVRELLNDPREDGLSLDDRVRRLAGDIVDVSRGVIRSGVLRGHSPSRISRDVQRAIDEEMWKVRRVIMTEGTNAYRLTVAEIAKQTGEIRAVRIIDNRGRHRNHENHECYRLAEQDMYGWGKGVYRPEDTFIYFPHPNCTAYYQLVLTDEARTGGAA